MSLGSPIHLLTPIIRNLPFIMCTYALVWSGNVHKFLTGALEWVVSLILFFIIHDQSFRVVWNVLIQGSAHRYVPVRHELLDLNILFYKWNGLDPFEFVLTLWCCKEEKSFSKKSKKVTDFSVQILIYLMTPALDEELHCLYPWWLHVWAWGAIQGLPRPSSWKPLEWSQNWEE